jgi:hypothetical protein
LRPPTLCFFSIIFHGAHEGQKRYGAGALDGMRQAALMFCTGAGYTPGNDFATFSNKISERFGIFVIDYEIGIGTKAANFAAVIYSFFSSTTGFSV